jgi:hypothetical protein
MELMTKYRSWILGDVAHPKTWFHSMGGVVLLGDVAHSVMVVSKAMIGEPVC